MHHDRIPASTRWDLEGLEAKAHEREARQDARITEHERSVAEKQQATSNALSALRAEFAALKTHLTGDQQIVEDNARRLDDLEWIVKSATSQLEALEARVSGNLQALEKQIMAQVAVIESLRESIGQTDNLVERVVEAFETKMAAVIQSAEDNATHLGTLEQKIDAMGQQNAVLEAGLVKAMHRFECEIEAQTAVVENVRISMAQTDDLVGRVVEAMETILVDSGVGP
jgi:uncharacterized protein YhaN